MTGSRRRLTALALAALLAPCLVAPAVVLLGAAPAHAREASRDPLPRPELLDAALDAYQRLERDGLVRKPLLTVIDYALPSSQPRLWVVEPRTQRVLFHEYVAHGRGSSDELDPDRLVRFGNQPASLRSSRGVFLTADTYIGKHGHSLNLTGLEPGVNDRALERRIVIHPAEYVSPAFRARSGGRVGRSWGCPALDPAVARTIIDRIEGGSVLFVDGRMPSTRTARRPGAMAGAGAAAAAGLGR